MNEQLPPTAYEQVIAEVRRALANSVACAAPSRGTATPPAPAAASTARAA